MQRLAFYILSMSMVFVAIGFFCMDIPICTEDNSQFIGWPELWKNTRLGIFIIIATMIVEFLVYLFLKKSWKSNASKLTVKVTEIDNINFDTLTLIASFCVPLVSFNYQQVNHWIVLALLLIVIGVIFCRSDGFYNNPTLALLGFRLYKAKFKTQELDQNSNNKSLVFISQDRIKKSDDVRYVSLSDKVGYAYIVKKDDKR